MEHLRWIVTITYRTDAGPADVEHHIEELHDVDAIVERGPDWNTIENIVIVLNPRRRAYMDTVEQAAKR